MDTGMELEPLGLGLGGVGASWCLGGENIAQSGLNSASRVGNGDNSVRFGQNSASRAGNELNSV